jgi:CheY-like chemotaxis protein
LKTLLLVEDIELNMDLLVQILEEDYGLLLARDGAEAVRLAETGRPDLVLMDISLPVIDGYEAARRIQRQTPGLPIIGLSSHAMEGDALRAQAAGCCAYLTKPVDEDLLRATIERYLS